MEEKNSQEQSVQKIELDAFFEAVTVALKEEFVARSYTYREEKTFKLRFSNGQVFVLAVWEEKNSRA